MGVLADFVLSWNGKGDFGMFAREGRRQSRSVYHGQCIRDNAPQGPLEAVQVARRLRYSA
jgi:hypothetical protein